LHCQRIASGIPACAESLALWRHRSACTWHGMHGTVEESWRRRLCKSWINYASWRCGTGVSAQYDEAGNHGHPHDHSGNRERVSIESLR
jgi:hypothetical protein